MSKNKNKQYLQGKESFSRMNFLYQASMLMAGRNDTLSAYYGQLCRSIGKKSTLRIEPNIKRDLCKRCSLAQKPGITSNLDAKTITQNNKSNIIVDEVQLTCQLCSYKRRLQVNTNYEFWLENPDSVAEVCNLNNKKKVEDENKK